MKEQEVDRLRRVYAGYRTDERNQRHWSEDNLGNQVILKERATRLQALMQQNGFMPLTGCRILDVGCGNGSVLASFLTLGASPNRLYGVDLLEDRIAVATRRFPTIHFSQANAETLDFSDAFFDMVLLFTVFTSILDTTMSQNVAAEVARVLKPGGGIVWYDFRYDNPRNAQVRGLAKKDIEQLFPGFDLKLQTITLLPPLARRLGKLTPFMYPILSTIPFLRTHYLGLLIKPS